MKRYLTASEYRKKNGVTDRRGPHGRRFCVCGKEVAAGRIHWCSDKCQEKFRDENDWTHIRRMVQKRDKGVCALCGWDTARASVEFNRSGKTWKGGKLLNATTLGIPHHRLNAGTDWWDADHIVPVVEGGSNKIENLRTLCIPCHRAETAKLRRRLANPRLRIFMVDMAGAVEISKRRPQKAS